MLYLGFYVLGSTADAYLSPVLASISKHLKLSQSLAISFEKQSPIIPCPSLTLPTA